MFRFLYLTRKIKSPLARVRCFSCNSDVIKVQNAVKEALLQNKPVLALESTIITHGMPYPDNLQMALSVEKIVHEHCATPATIGMVDGVVYIGMGEDMLKRLATHPSPVKLSRRDLAVGCSKQLTGGTTVSATMLLAHKFGIDIFATGGIGGVHLLGQESMDISADLRELGQTPITVVSAGVKSILDIGRTLEYLETEGVTVATFGNTKDFPAFFTRKSGFKSPYCVSGITEAAELIQSHQKLKLGSGMLIAAPIPKEFKASGTKIENSIKLAQQEASSQGIQGKEVTPFILRRVNDITKGESLKSNIQLMLNNAKIGAQIARELKTTRTKTTTASTTKTRKKIQTNQPVVIGGCNVDFVSKATQPLVHGGPSNPAVVQQSFGGVGRNIAETLWRLNNNPLLISALGSDYVAQLLMSHLKGMDTSGISILPDHRTGAYNAIFNYNGELDLAVEDSDIHRQINTEMVEQHVDSIIVAPMVCLDANIAYDAINFVCGVCNKHNIPLLLEPTGELKAAQGYMACGEYTDVIKYMTPNVDELKAIYEAVTLQQAPSVDFESDLNSSLTKLVGMCRPLLDRIRCINVTMGRFGVFCAANTPSPTFTHYPLTPAPKWGWLTHPISNVSGSGDGFAAGFTHGLLRGHDLNASVQIGITIAQRALRSSEAVNQKLTERDAVLSNGCWPKHQIHV
uniref:pseudouridine-metabolizing bifunctional protein C1861.05 n=1 Tax=Ciona intestinalis TaxID=7719 RepID=UPI000180B362|nr:pseudouridine-metabolizing bifunctional protein C1861.05 [Ciona intestinalis]|eukprot:XP_018671741.1 pseudouridine-metabolizing bifunctional protein C1861.05 [Ciona intestinalis]